MKISELNDIELIQLMDISRKFEKKEDFDFSWLIDTMLDFYNGDPVIKKYTGTYIPIFKREIHREIERRFKERICYKGL